LTSRQVWKLFWVFIIIYGLNSTVFADTIDDPCGGPSALLNIIDRPSASDSACAVAFKKAMLETGYQYQKLTHSAGYEQNFPEAEFRVGLPARNEISVVLPNYIHQSMAPHSGNTATVVGIKHEIGYNQNWLGAVEALFTLPSANAAFGSQGLGSTVNGIISYTFNPKLNLTLMMGGSTQTQSNFDGGKRFSSINPDLIFTYSPTEKMDIYGEIYGQTKTGPRQGSGFNADGGALFLILPSFEIDVELGQRISGNLNGIDHYIGTGMAVLIG
jgi:hypothetical protein